MLRPFAFCISAFLLALALVAFSCASTEHEKGHGTAGLDQGASSPAQELKPVNVHPALPQSAEPGPALPDFTATPGLEGELISQGSDALSALIYAWGKAFGKLCPGVRVREARRGGSAGATSLIQKECDMAQLSAPLSERQMQAFRDWYGYEPTGFKVAVDALAVFVHRNNPIEKLTLQQLDAIFSTTRRAGAPADATKWGDLGLGGEWEHKPLSLFGRNSASHAYGLFKSIVLLKGDYKVSIQEQPGSSTVVALVARDTGAIGYAGAEYGIDGVRAVAIARGSEDRNRRFSRG
jgi:phosphate transport system substrate-binding protein